MTGTTETQMVGGAGYGGNGLGGVGLFGLIGLNGLNGINGNNTNDGHCVKSFQEGLQFGTGAKTSDVIDAKNAIMTSQNFGFDRIDGSVRDGNIQLGMMNYQTQGMIKDVAFATSSQTCELKSAIAEDGMKTRELINANTVQDLRDRLDASETSYNFASRGLLEATGPNMSIAQPYVAVPAPNPCATNHSNEQINVINNNVNAIGSQVTQLAGIVAGLQK